MDANDLARWTRFAAKGGIGKCTATHDCAAESPDDLMFFTDDEITVLMQLPDEEGKYLGYCEGVVGRFLGEHVHFHSKLKKPIMAKRSSMVAAKSPTPTLKSPSPIPPPSGRSSRPPTDDEATTPPTMSFSSSSTLSDGSLTTPPLPRQNYEQIFDLPVRSPTLVLTPTSPLVISPKASQTSYVVPVSPPPPSAPASANSSGQTLDVSYGEDPPSARYSVAMSDDGGFGIGLSLLQGLANGDDDWSSAGSRYSVRSNLQTPENDEDDADASQPTPDTPHGPALKSTPSPPLIAPAPIATRPRGLSTSSSMKQSLRSEDWEGASDIYDDYRYSRFSQTSKTSRLSQGSHSQPRVAPPLPDVRRRRDSTESDASVYTQASKDATGSSPPGSRLSVRVQPPPNPADAKSRPAGLDLNPGPSPLLHTTWGSASSSPSIYSAGSFYSPPAGSTAFTGAATALRQKIAERSTPSPQDSQSETEPRKIVIEDDEEIPAHIQRDSTFDRPIRDSTFERPFQESPSPEPSSPISPTADDSQTLTLPDSLSPVPEDGPPSSPLPLDMPPSPGAVNVSPSPRIPRPSLSELRGDTAVAQRTSLFLPHPNAPKPTVSSAGPMYTREPMPMNHQSQGPNNPANPAAHAVNIIRAAVSGPPRPGPATRGPTIYGKIDLDLSSASGPVPMSFTLQPPPIPAAAPGKAPPSPLRTGFIPFDAPRTRSGSTNSEVSTGAAIPRANFFPKAGTSRPRSRSFSGFNSASVPTKPMSSLEEGSSLPGKPHEPFSTFGIPRSTSTPQTNSTVSGSPPLSKQASTSNLKQVRPTLHPSPLSLPQNIIVNESKNAQSPSSPVGRHVLRKTRSTLNEATSPTSSPGRTGLFRTLGPDINGSPPQVIQKQPSYQAVSSRTSISHSRNPTGEGLSPAIRSTMEMDDASVISNGRSNAISPQPVLTRETSLRSKLSLPNLRRSQSRQNSISSSSPIVEPSSLVQVQDMDFELIRPTMPHSLVTRNSQESFANRDPSFDSRSLNAFRSDSPAMSMASNSGQLSPVNSDSGRSKLGKASAPDASIDAHRQRELKWINMMSATPAAQARKSKKVRKLLGEGVVPSSVRYMVWSHLMDGKAKNVPGVYTQLGQRGRVPAFGDIERDVQRCFSDYPQLLTAQGPILSLLQAYLTMVPDIQYTTGLTLIAGHLLLLAPEEDAFWTFLSIMDSYLRPYFSGSTQMEVDAALFAKALESNDAHLAKKVLTELSMPPARICYPWFTTLFIGTLPTDYVNRVWDLFLYEGMPFLLRVGLAVIYCCRHAIHDARSDEAVLSCLKRPPPQWLPSTPDAFISLALTMKVKDDDVRKQRVKMEAQMKRQTQQLPRTSGISMPRT